MEAELQQLRESAIVSVGDDNLKDQLERIFGPKSTELPPKAPPAPPPLAPPPLAPPPLLPARPQPPSGRSRSLPPQTDGVQLEGVEKKLESLVRAVTSLEARFDERDNGASNDTDSIVSGAETRKAYGASVRRETVSSDARLKMLLRRAASFDRSTHREKTDRAQSAWNRERRRQYARELQR